MIPLANPYFYPILHKQITSATCARAYQGSIGMTMGATLRAGGTTPPVVTVAGTTPGAIALRIEITTGGAVGAIVFRYSGNGGLSWIEQTVSPTAGTYACKGAAQGITITFPAGTYTSDNVYQGTCSAWADLSGNNLALAQPDPTQQPLFIVSPGGRIGLRFDGSTSNMVESTFSYGAPLAHSYYFFATMKQSAWTLNHGPYGTGVGTLLVIGSPVTPQLRTTNGSLSNTNPAAVIGTAVRLEAAFTGSAPTCFLKIGASLASGSSSGNSTPSAGLNLGCTANGNVATAGWNGDIYDFMVFINAIPTTTERAAVDAAVTVLSRGGIAV